METNKNSNSFNYFLSKNWEEFSGQWVALLGNKILSKNEDLGKVIDNVSQYESGKITFARIPDKDSVLVL